MAQIRKRGKTWQYQVEWKDPVTGERRTKSKGGFSSGKAADFAAQEVEKQLFEGNYAEEKNISFIDFANEWLDFYAKHVKPSSARAREKETKHFKKYFGLMKVKDITRKQYQSVLNDLHEKGYAHNTLDGIHSTGRMIFKRALEYGVIKSSPTEFAKIPKRIETVEEIENEQDDMKFLEKDELITFLKAAKNKGLDRDFEMFMTLAYSGLRVGELLALKWPDINFNNNSIRITKTYYNPNNNTKSFQLLTPKTKGSIRTLKMDPLVMMSLKKHRAHQNELKMMYRDIYTDFEFVFAKEINYPGYPDFIKTVENRMRRLLKISGIDKNVTPHSLRHTHTSLLIEAGVGESGGLGIKEIQQRLGHSDINTTMDIYAHITKNMEEKASQKFSELMRGVLED